MLSNIRANIALFLVLGLLTLVPSVAQATFVSPKRVMIDDGKRAAQLMIYNRTQDTLVYTFEWQHRIMTADGESKLLEAGQTAPGYSPADPFLVFSPRQVVVRPGETQILRLYVRDPENKLTDGEYHSYILIKSEPVRKPQEQERLSEVPNMPTVSGSVQMKANMALPVFIRRGATAIDFDITSPRFGTSAKGRPQLSANITNRSTRSIYIKPELVCTKADGEVQKTTMNTIRLYKQVKSFMRDWHIPKKAPPLESCVSLDLQLSSVDDFEYGRGVLKTVKLK